MFVNKNPSNKFLQKHYKNNVFIINDTIIKLFQKTQIFIEDNFRYIRFENFDNELSTRDNYKIFNSKYKPTIKFSNTDASVRWSCVKKTGLPSPSFCLITLGLIKILRNFTRKNTICSFIAWQTFTTASNNECQTRPRLIQESLENISLSKITLFINVVFTAPFGIAS